MGELQHGTYNDECEGLTQEEINVVYGFDKVESQLIRRTVINWMPMIWTRSRKMKVTKKSKSFSILTSRLVFCKLTPSKLT